MFFVSMSCASSTVPLLTVGALQSTTLPMVAASYIKQFITQIFLHPGDNMVGVIVIGVLGGGTLIGLAFLSKLVYEKYCPEKQEPS